MNISGFQNAAWSGATTVVYSVCRGLYYPVYWCLLGIIIHYYPVYWCLLGIIIHLEPTSRFERWHCTKQCTKQLNTCESPPSVCRPKYHIDTPKASYFGVMVISWSCFQYQIPIGWPPFGRCQAFRFSSYGTWVLRPQQGSPWGCNGNFGRYPSCEMMKNVDFK